MPDVPLVDTHVHLWDPQRLRYPWLDGNATLNRAFLPTDYRAACGPVAVEALVFVQCAALPAQALAEAQWVQDLAATAEPRLQGIVADAALEHGERVRPHLMALARLPLVRGVRRLIQQEPLEFCRQPAFVQGVQLLPEFGFSFDLCCRHHQLPAVIELVRRCPQVTFVLDHLGKPDVRGRRLDPWRAHLNELASFPNVWAKLSGLATEADPAQWTSADLRPYIDHLLDCFGSERVCFGGDWPVLTLAGTLPRWVAAFDEALAPLAAPVRAAICRENARRCYRLSPAA